MVETLFWVGGAGWGWVSKYFGWVGASGDEWRGVAVSGVDECEWGWVHGSIIPLSNYY